MSGAARTVASLTKLSSNKTFGGWMNKYSHISQVLGGLEMKFSVFLPAVAENRKVPVIYWLSGLTCTDENFSTKACAQNAANLHGVALVIPDTSPRGAGIPGEDDAYDFGSGAGFYLNATTEAWKKHYNMYDYIVKELPALVEAELPVLAGRENTAISGHSMGGHGALTIALKNPEKYVSASAFSPICHPTQVPWGQKAFKGYLGDDVETWKAYDAVELLKTYQGPDLHLLVDQGSCDNFLIGDVNQLLPADLEQVCAERNIPLKMRLQEGYDHSYWFIASFIGDHIAHHVACMGAK